jgi:hypothetical protein
VRPFIGVCSGKPGFKTFLNDILQQDLVQGQVGDEAFEFGVFVAQLLQLAGFTWRHAAIDLLPAIERLLGDPDLAILRRRPARPPAATPR